MKGLVLTLLYVFFVFLTARGIMRMEDSYFSVYQTQKDVSPPLPKNQCLECHSCSREK